MCLTCLTVVDLGNIGKIWVFSDSVHDMMCDVPSHLVDLVLCAQAIKISDTKISSVNNIYLMAF